MLLTNTVFLVPVEFHAQWTQTLIAALCVYAAVLTAPIIDATLINICQKAPTTCYNFYCYQFFFSNGNERKRRKQDQGCVCRCTVPIETHLHSGWGRTERTPSCTNTESCRGSWYRCDHRSSQRNTHQCLRHKENFTWMICHISQKLVTL